MAGILLSATSRFPVPAQQGTTSATTRSPIMIAVILIETSSQPKYEKTRLFYTRLDYKEVARIPDFYRKGDDRITYVKYLA
jgi:hypothetical protein